MEQEYQIQVEWRGYELHPEIPILGIELLSFLKARYEETYKLYQQRAEKAGLVLVVPPVIPNTRMALEACGYACEHGKQKDFQRVVFRKYFCEGKNIGLWDVLRTAGEEVGLDPEEMQRETINGKYTDILNSNINQALALGIMGLPAYILGSQDIIEGAQPYEVFVEALARIQAESIELSSNDH